ncbi:MAG: NAD(P)/FAD-dependent oxidoreductase, partial [Oscillospiraceae bacterium]
KVHSITRGQRRRLLELLKCFPIVLTGPRPVEEAIVTSGGIKVSEIDPKTMQSKLVPGLFFAGEIIDVDAYTGGFNLQIAWATGHAAGQAAARRGKEGEL